MGRPPNLSQMDLQRPTSINQHNNVPVKINVPQFWGAWNGSDFNQGKPHVQKNVHNGRYFLQSRGENDFLYSLSRFSEESRTISHRGAVPNRSNLTNRPNRPQFDGA